MKLHELRPAPGSTKKRKRIGRGHSAGQGKTAGRGHKGQLSRSGGGKGPGFEGGQNPLQRRIPKLPGFTNRFKKVFSIVNVGGLNVFDEGSVVDAEALAAKGLIKNAKLPLKVLGNGDLEKKLTVKAAVFSAVARDKILAGGGGAEQA